MASQNKFINAPIPAAAAKEDKNNEITFEQFSSGDLKQIQITVVGSEKKFFKHQYYIIEVKSPNFPAFLSYRRFTDFYALDQALRIRYSNLQLPEFPNKFQMFGKIENRKSAFNKLLNLVLKISIEHSALQINLLKTLHTFLIKDISGSKNPTMKRVTVATRPEEKMTSSAKGSMQSRRLSSNFSEENNNINNNDPGNIVSEYLENFQSMDSDQMNQKMNQSMDLGEEAKEKLVQVVKIDSTLNSPTKLPSSNENKINQPDTPINQDLQQQKLDKKQSQEEVKIDEKPLTPLLPKKKNDEKITQNNEKNLQIISETSEETQYLQENPNLQGYL